MTSIINKTKLIITRLFLLILTISTFSLNTHAADDVWMNVGLAQKHGFGNYSFEAVPRTMDNFTGGVDIDVSRSHTLLRKSDNTVWSTGLNTSGQLGHSTNSNLSSVNQVTGLTNVAHISVGSKHSVAVKSDGTVWTWGDNSQGQLGYTTTNLANSTPVQVPGLTGILKVEAGAFHNIARKNDGTIWTWGSNEFGQLGNGTQNQSTTPIQVSGVSGALDVEAGQGHSLYLNSTGLASAFGRNIAGELGHNNAIEFSTTPVNVVGGQVFVRFGEVTEGTAQSFAIDSSARAYHWGYMNDGNLAGYYIGSPTCFGSVTVPGGNAFPCRINAITSISDITGSFGSGLASIQTINDIHYGGITDNGLSGNNTIGDNLNILTNITSLAGPTASKIKLGGSSIYVLKTDGTVRVWGSNEYRQLGYNATVIGATDIPAIMNFDDTYTNIASNYYISLASRNDGAAFSWGSNYFGHRGVGTTTNDINYNPQQIPGLTNIVNVSAWPYGSAVHSLRGDGAVYGWGNDAGGDVGDGAGGGGDSPIQIIAPGGATRLHDNCASNSSNQLYCWGRSANTLSMPSGTNPSPILVASNVVDWLRTGYSQSSVLMIVNTSGQVQTRGNAGSGILGGGSLVTDHPSFTNIGLSNITDVELDGSSLIARALQNDGTVWG
ncbi:MAG: hypothetical protein HC932_03270, partial [Thermales bacterium]|nr:hypothetical protein [Thermales bacterium]